MCLIIAGIIAIGAIISVLETAKIQSTPAKEIARW